MKRISGIALLAGVAAGSMVPVSVAAKAPASKATSAIEAPTARCASLTGLKLPGTSITSAVLVPGKEAETSIAGDAAGYRSFCRVVAHVRSAPGSDIGVEIWLPVAGWAGVFHGNGNGGFAGILAGG
ncbi:MAG: tannase/feruloyl esterase family alpha/beta hydrolase, partial [Sphingopyxis sp.]